jgi:anti-anti-sigma factor
MSQIPRVTAVDVAIHSTGAIVTVVGDLDLASAQPFLDGALPAVDRARGDLTVDLSGVGFCDSSGLTALIKVRQRCTERGSQFRTVNLQPPVRRVVVDYGGLGDYLNVQ